MPKNTLQEQSEEIIEANICEFLMYRGASLDKIISEGYYDPKLKMYRPRKSAFANPGISDIIGCHQGRYFAIEVKQPSEMDFFDKPIEELEEQFKQAERRNLSKATLKRYHHAVVQRKFLDEKIAKGGIAFIASSIEQVKEGFKEFNHII